MESKFREIRRQDRLLKPELIEEVLKTGEYGILSVGLNENGYPYGVPLNFVYSENRKCLYFHGAKEGEKLDILDINQKASFCIVRNTKVLPDQFVTSYESVILFGTINSDIDDSEKLLVLNMVLDKYSPDYKELGEEHIKMLFSKVKVLKFEIKHKAGKQH